MKKTVTAVLLLSILAAVTAFGQWQDLGVFPKAGLAAGDTIHYSIHGLATDPDGKLWVLSYYAYPEDSILVPNYGARIGNLTHTITDSIVSKYVAVRVIRVYNPNGTQASFSPIKYLTVNAHQDTIGGASLQAYTGAPWLWDPTNSPNSGRGLRTDQNGNIIACVFNIMYRINYKTGAGMAKGLENSAGASCVSPGIDVNGYVYNTKVASGAAPLAIFNPDLTFLQNAVDTLDPNSFCRALEVSKDGNDIYFPGYTDRAIYRYRSPAGVLGSFATRIDTILKGFHCESIAWNTKKSGTNAYLWASAGSFNDQPNDWPGLTTKYTPGTWYAVDTTGAGTVKDSIKWTFFVAGNVNERPRAIAFSKTGDTAWAGTFGLVGHGNPSLRMYRRIATGINVVNNNIPSGYALQQNFPNPFNPTTEIEFKVAKAGLTTLRVYDIVGREVSTLVNQSMNPGTFRVKLDATNLATGTYIYTLSSGDARITKKMMLLK
jgi:hypothetical protein